MLTHLCPYEKRYKRRNWLATPFLAINPVILYVVLTDAVHLGYTSTTVIIVTGFVHVRVSSAQNSCCFIDNMYVASLNFHADLCFLLLLFFLGWGGGADWSAGGTEKNQCTKDWCTVRNQLHRFQKLRSAMYLSAWIKKERGLRP